MNCINFSGSNERRRFLRAREEAGRERREDSRDVRVEEEGSVGRAWRRGKDEVEDVLEGGRKEG